MCSLECFYQTPAAFDSGLKVKVVTAWSDYLIGHQSIDAGYIWVEPDGWVR